MERAWGRQRCWWVVEGWVSERVKGWEGGEGKHRMRESVTCWYRGDGKSWARLEERPNWCASQRNGLQGLKGAKISISIYTPTQPPTPGTQTVSQARRSRKEMSTRLLAEPTTPFKTSIYTPTILHRPRHHNCFLFNHQVFLVTFAITAGLLNSCATTHVYRSIARLWLSPYTYIYTCTVPPTWRMEQIHSGNMKYPEKNLVVITSSRPGYCM